MTDDQDGAGRIIDPAHRDFHRRWTTLKPPLRPHPNVASAIRRLLPETDRPILLLGVTPELAVIPRRTLAVDWSERMIAVAWPGDNDDRRVIMADWRALPLEAASVPAAIGDGSITMLQFPEDVSLLLEQLRRVIEPGGRAVIRCFTTPEEGESLEQVVDAALSGECSFHAFKLRLNMASALEAGLQNMPCDSVFRCFQTLFPDRQELAEASGWSLDEIAEIDAYDGSPYVQCYPRRSELMGIMPSWIAQASFAETEGYPLAERCPLLVIDFP
jgi:SAM-dependent methyltransferase